MELESKVVEIEQRCKSNSHRIDKLEHDTEAINRLATSVEVMAVEQKQTGEKVSKIDKKVDALEAVPAKRWNLVVEKIILTVLAAVVGYVLAKGGL